MQKCDTGEKGLETIITDSLVNMNGYEEGTNQDYSREYVVDKERLLRFIKTTQPEKYKRLGLDEDSPKMEKFLHRVKTEILKRGVIYILRNGILSNSDSVEMFYGIPSPENKKAVELHRKNIFSVTRQLRYSKDQSMLALDMAVFINGLPIATFELKNRLTKQTVEDAVQQYKNDRSPKEGIFRFGVCMVHFALDDTEVRMCTRLEGKRSWFLPFNKGYNDGGGNPPNPEGIATDYLWKEILTKESLTNIIENYAQLIEEKNGKKKTKKQYFPRYHQLDVVRKLLADAKENGAGRKYLIQHSAGSGKSNSIAWLAHQLVDLRQEGKGIFDSIIVVTDRILLDDQISNTVKQFTQVRSVVGHANRSGDLRKFISSGKKIIISTIQKFPFILDEMGKEHRNRKFAIIIDEAHSSQGGRNAAKMNITLSKT